MIMSLDLNKTGADSSNRSEKKLESKMDSDSSKQAIEKKTH